MSSSAASLTTAPTLCSLENPTFTSPTWIAINYIVFLLVIYVITRLSAVFLKRIDPKRWATFSEEMRVNVISYVVEIILTTAALGCQLAVIRMLDPNYQYNLSEFQIARTAVNLVCLLYTSELLFRRKLRLTLITHHVVTVGIAIMLVVAFENTFDLHVTRIGLAFMFQATLEQATFLGLLFYRYRPNTQLTYMTLLIGAIVPMLLKLVSIGYVVAMWAKYIAPLGAASPSYVAMDVLIPVGGLLLLFTQVWSAMVVYKLALRSKPVSDAGAAAAAQLESGVSSDPESDERDSGETEKPFDPVHRSSTAPVKRSSTTKSFAPLKRSFTAKSSWSTMIKDADEPDDIGDFRMKV
ncbi:hypothetical protein M427DRAFT_58631 [Gonapodya prolifera JEL478]|uniref:TLC domain-containing protein n=1 Tax=Gonapodya prolifera (strain JEL478) TaxID=1344416 RepID=A0A139A982_GONPJ|nr:hypothetical protein M427DRAFT_58631 [Gonapodya prolifera JEL478]|eukprot:KXS13382.1 hypothetical protein M427DRAFT_58631 [Gonapodya prolifera JEL478]